MRIIIAKDYLEISRKAAHIIAGQMIMKPDSVLGLATGSTPLGTYRYLVHMYMDGLISFDSTVSFNLDEYIGLGENSDQSYIWFMQKNLFNMVDIRKKNIFIPSGVAGNIHEECANYEKKIAEKGGIDIQLLGIGRNGHIGFNEPDIKFEAATHMVNLDEDTIEANSRFFKSIDDVPKQAISMGIKTIMHSKKVLLLANGKEKASTVHDMIFGEIKPTLPASILQLHPDCTVILDEGAASEIMNKLPEGGQI